jgi:hypothetical protein
MTLTPHQISDARIGLAEEYSKYCGQLADLMKKQAEHFNTYRNDFKSDKATERAFDATDDGVKMAIIKLKLKSIEKTLSAYNSHLRLLENEAKNLY